MSARSREEILALMAQVREQTRGMPEGAIDAALAELRGGEQTDLLAWFVGNAETYVGRAADESDQDVLTAALDVLAAVKERAVESGKPLMVS